MCVHTHTHTCRCHMLHERTGSHIIRQAVYRKRTIKKVMSRILFSLIVFCIELGSMCSVSTCIEHQTAVTVRFSDDVNRHSSSFKMAVVLEEWTKKEVQSVIRLLRANNFHLLKFTVSLWQYVVVMWWQYSVCVSGAGSLTVDEWMWSVKNGEVGRPRLLILFRLLIQQSKWADVWLLLNCN